MIISVIHHQFLSLAIQVRILRTPNTTILFINIPNEYEILYKKMSSIDHHHFCSRFWLFLSVVWSLTDSFSSMSDFQLKRKKLVTQLSLTDVEFHSHSIETTKLMALYYCKEIDKFPFIIRITNMEIKDLRHMHAINLLIFVVWF